MAPTVTIVIADRQPELLPPLSDKIDLQFNYKIAPVASFEELQACLRSTTIEFLLLDFAFSTDPDFSNLVAYIQKTSPKTTILPLLPQGQPQLMKHIFDLDLFHFLHKPLMPEEFSLVIKRASAPPPPQPTKSQSKKDSIAEPHFQGMIGTSKPMLQLFDLVNRVAEDDLSTVLIRGESGTGKEMVAKAIHAKSKRCNKNFVPVNCAAIPDDLLESELFGYTKGAFTGASTNKQGRIQYAHEGTLFLDEIGDMKSSLQAKLLRVLQEKEFEPVGSLKAIPVNTRILAATHCNLEELVNEGKFREDLYYRLSVVPINIPPLKERADDIPLLIEAFLKKYTEDRGRDSYQFSSRAFTALTLYQWRGNVRELENLMQHMSILFSGKLVHLENLPEKFHDIDIPDSPQITNDVIAPTPIDIEATNEVPNTLFQDTVWDKGQVDFKELINDFETELIIKALQRTGGNKKEAARLLNLKRTTLLEKIKKKAIDHMWEK